jgi:hypothetical protein
MKKEIVIEHKENKDYKLILRVNLNEEDEALLKKNFNLLALSQNLSSEQYEILETLFGYYWYRHCKINIIKQNEQNLQRAKVRSME